MFEFHKDRLSYFNMQVENCRDYVLPFIEQTMPVRPGMKVLEIGCGEAGVLKPFLDRGCICTGVEFDVIRLENAAVWLKDEIAAGKLRLISKDIYDVDAGRELNSPYDLIILKDVIEHIHDQPKLITALKQFLKPGGAVFFGFPPWQMPFGGHQQICRGKWMSRMPYYHLLPRPLYRYLLKRNNEPVDELMEVRDTRISIEKFERIARKCGYAISGKTHYLINPIYKYKFGWKGRRQLPVLRSIPWVRNFFTTCVYYLITPQQ